jgi:serine/threonine-protein kinase
MTSHPSPDPHADAYLRRATTSTPAGLTSSAPLSPEVHRDRCRRLAGLALCYSGAYALAYGIMWVRMLAGGLPEHHPVADAVALASIAFGLVVFALALQSRLPQAAFGNVTVAFQILGAIGIMASGWGWEQHYDMWQRHLFQAIGDRDLAFPDDFVARLRAAHIRLVAMDGVSWVCVWFLIVPIIVPMTPGRTLVATLGSAATVPGLVALSAAVNGTPPSVAPWFGDVIVDSLVATGICALLALFGSRLVYRLTRDLSRAQQLGSYQLVRRIGAGGMGEVWQARHQLLRRPAAIKLIRPEMLGGTEARAPREVLRRFEREAQATAALRSPHTVELYDFGVAPDGTFYYVMELLEGFDLKTLVERFGPLPAPRAVHLLRQVCHSLEDAHRSGLVHRDVKPANIFTCRRGLDCDFVKVLDFGLVKDLGTGQETLEMSVDGVARGTPAFMAPEAATGTAPVDARADLYALGCVAYWLVTGALVFEGPTPVATLLKHVQEEPVPPSRRLSEPIPARLERLIMACLRKDPAQRPASAAALAALLAECAAHDGTWKPADADAWWTLHAPAPAAPVPA